MECKCWWIIEQGNDKVGRRSHKNQAGHRVSIRMRTWVREREGATGRWEEEEEEEADGGRVGVEGWT